MIPKIDNVIDQKSNLSAPMMAIPIRLSPFSDNDSSSIVNFYFTYSDFIQPISKLLAAITMMALIPEAVTCTYILLQYHIFQCKATINPVFQLR